MQLCHSVDSVSSHSFSQSTRTRASMNFRNNRLSLRACARFFKMRNFFEQHRIRLAALFSFGHNQFARAHRHTFQIQTALRSIRTQFCFPSLAFEMDTDATPTATSAGVHPAATSSAQEITMETTPETTAASRSAPSTAEATATITATTAKTKSTIAATTGEQQAFCGAQKKQLQDLLAAFVNGLRLGSNPSTINLWFIQYSN